jgi:hypothetical protein
LKQTILASGGNEFSDIYKSADLAALQNAKVTNQLLVIVTAPYPTPSRLVETFINTLMGEALLAAVENQAVVMGSSAGAMLMSKRVIMPSGEDLGEGLNLLRESIVLPHFHSNVPNWINEYRSQNIKFIGLAEGSSILTSVTEETSITEFGSVTYL